MMEKIQIAVIGTNENEELPEKICEIAASKIILPNIVQLYILNTNPDSEKSGVFEELAGCDLVVTATNQKESDEKIMERLDEVNFPGEKISLSADHLGEAGEAAEEKISLAVKKLQMNYGLPCS